MTAFKRAFVISPYSGDIAKNVKFAQKCLHWCFAGGYAPFAGHLVYPQVLDDNDPKEREFGMASAYAFLAVCDVAFSFMDLGVSRGMRADLDAARRLKVRIEYVSITPGVIPRVDAIHALSLPHDHMPCAACQIEKQKEGA